MASNGNKMLLIQSLEEGNSTTTSFHRSSNHEFQEVIATMPPEMPMTPSSSQEEEERGHIPSSHDNCDARRHAEEENPTISISSTSKIAGMTVAPFLSKHIPDQYAPLGPASGEQQLVTIRNPSSKYCYRHRPDLKCRRTANEPSMDNLQRDLETLSSADQQGISHVWSLFSAAPAKHRNLMLQGILTQCCFPQLSYLSTAVSDLIRIDFITALPNELAFKILCYLDTTSLCKAAQVSQNWRIAADDDVVWHKMCEQHIDRKCTKCGWGLPLLERRRLREWKRQQQLRATGRGRNEWSPELTPQPESNIEIVPTSSAKRSAPELDESTIPDTKRICNDESKSESKTKFRPWKEVYKDRFKVGTNWKYGRCSTKIFRGHSNGVTCLQFEDNMLATGSYDCTIKIWDIESGEVVQTLRGHQTGIRALQFDDTKLISGSLDKTIKIWNWRTGECISTYQGHTEGVLSVHFSGNLLASGSIDQSIKIWNFEDKSTFSLRGHTEWVNAVKIDMPSRTVFSASDDLTARLWDLDTRSCIKIFDGHVGQVQQVIPLPPDFEWDESVLDQTKDDDNADSVSSDNGITHNVDDLKLEVCENARQAFGPAFGNNRPLPPRYMLTAGLDSTVRLWCVATGKCLKTFFGHVEGVWALAGDSLRVVSGAQDRMVKVWDARTGKCDRTFTGHSSAVTCIGLSDSRMITGSEDHEVRLYSFKSEEEAVACREGVDLKWRGRGITELGWAEGAHANIR